MQNPQYGFEKDSFSAVLTCYKNAHCFFGKAVKGRENPQKESKPVIVFKKMSFMDQVLTIELIWLKNNLLVHKNPKRRCSETGSICPKILIDRT